MSLLSLFAFLPVVAIRRAPTHSASGVTVFPPASALASESRRLLGLAAQLEAIEKQYLAAVARKQETRALAVELMPAVPDELIVPRGESLDWVCEEESDVDNKEIYVCKDRPARRVITADGLRKDIDDGVYDGRTRAGRRRRALLPIAVAYEASRETAAQASGYNAARDQASDAAKLLERVATLILKCPCKTLEGVAIKARAMRAAVGAGDDDWYSVATRTKLLYAERLASDILRIAA